MKPYNPKFDYQDFDVTTTDFGRLYHTPIGPLSSLTTMLSKTKDMSGLQEWRDNIGHKKADLIMNTAGEKGDKLHDLLEQYFIGNDISTLLKTLPENVVQGYNCLKMHFSNITEIWGLEVALYDNELRIAGKTDVVGCWNEVPSIIDWKGSIRTKKPEWIIDYKIQLLFYALAHNQMYSTDIQQGVILIAVENDMPQKIVVDFSKESWLYDELAKRINDYRLLDCHELLVGEL